MVKTKTSPSPERTKNLLFQKVGIFVDAENIETSGLKHHEGRTDYKKILDRVGDREIIRILYYKPEYKEISPEFESFWSSLGGEIRRPTKNADTFLVIDAVTMAEKIDVAIILGGDKDFLPLIWYLRSRGCRTEIWSWPETTSPEMQQAADLYFPLTDNFVIRSERAERGSRPEREASSRGESPSREPVVRAERGEGGGRGEQGPRAERAAHKASSHAIESERSASSGRAPANKARR